MVILMILLGIFSTLSPMSDSASLLLLHHFLYLFCWACDLFFMKVELYIYIFLFDGDP
ncbi:hypothetical protein V6Z11_A11G264400 [Gossypium hirsutum]